MMTHGGVEIHVVILKFSYIIRDGSDIITEYVNKKQPLSQSDADELRNVKKFQITSSLKQANTKQARVSVQTLLTDKRLPIH